MTAGRTITSTQRLTHSHQPRWPRVLPAWHGLSDHGIYSPTHTRTHTHTHSHLDVDGVGCEDRQQPPQAVAVIVPIHVALAQACSHTNTYSACVWVWVCAGRKAWRIITLPPRGKRARAATRKAIPPRDSANGTLVTAILANRTDSQTHTHTHTHTPVSCLVMTFLKKAGLKMRTVALRGGRPRQLASPASSWGGATLAGLP